MEWTGGNGAGDNECHEPPAAQPAPVHNGRHHTLWTHTLTSTLAHPHDASSLLSPYLVTYISQAEEKLYTLVEHVPVASFKELETKVVEDMGDDE